MEWLVVRLRSTGHGGGRADFKVVSTGFGARTVAAKEELEAQTRSSGIRDAFHLFKFKMRNLTFFLQAEDAGDGEWCSRVENLLARGGLFGF